ncbi:MAG: glycosyltransferase [Turicibacter sp.]|nr:glycosyltransferase [Turicibacter sp.]
MNNINKLVSIIIPVYNGSNYLKEAIDSALAQTYKNIEILVINDGSTDNTEEIAQSYGDRIRYFKKENGGVSTALNMGIENMKGEYFSWLSHDDIYYPNRTELLINALYEDGDMTKLAWGDCENFYENTGRKVRRGPDEKSTKITDSVFPIISGFVGGCAILIHRSHFDRVGYFREDLRYTQDIEMWLRMFRGQQSVYVPHFMHITRIHSEAVSNTKKKEHMAAMVDIGKNIAISLSADEITRLFGNLRKFYYYINLTRIIQHDGNSLLVKSLFRSQFTSTQWEKYLQNQRTYAEKTFANRDICIFCAGGFGIRVYSELKMLNLSTKYFADNDLTKHGTIIVDDVKCLSFEELAKIKDEVMVIVATVTPDNIIEQLQNANFSHITSKQAIEKDLYKIMESI